MAAAEVQAYLETRTLWHSELQNGKMFGVAVVRNSNGQLGYLAAFSGNIDGKNRHKFFVPPIFDLLNPDGRFKKEEQIISDLNKKIAETENSPETAVLRKQMESVRCQAEKEIETQRDINRQHKTERDILRKSHQLTASQLDSLVRQSQFEKAELRRLEQRWKQQTENLSKQLAAIEAETEILKRQRRQMSENLQQWLFEQYVVMNARGEQKTILQIFADERGILPPAATGECAAPKMLQYAFIHHLKPIAMGEFWWGKSPEGELRRHGQFYPACHNRCEPLLKFMLQGLDVETNRLNQTDLQIKVLYDDQWIVAVNKPAGLLSVPGKGKADSALAQLQKKYGSDIDIQPVHRLDMQTSGVLLFAKDKSTQAVLMQQFEQRKVHKRYIAVVEGVPQSKHGVIKLPLRPNPDDRPRQVVDFENGKDAVTYYNTIDNKNGKSIVEFFPATGRTHQLRVHAAHKKGLNCPIVGDNLYGTPADRLFLHASEIVFRHPETGKRTVVISREVIFNFK